MKKRIGLFGIYIVLLAVLGALTADERFRQELTAEKKVVWFIGLLLFYALLTLLTNKIMSFLGSIAIKCADAGSYEPEAAKNRCLNYMLILYYVHIVLLYATHFLHLPAWTAYLNFGGILIVLVLLIRSRSFANIGKKLIVSVPFITYSVLDMLAMK